MNSDFHYEFNKWNLILLDRREQVIIVPLLYNYFLFRLLYTKEIFYFYFYFWR